MAEALDTRRGLLKKGLLGGLILAIGGTAAIGLRGPRRRRAPREPLQVLSPAEYAILATVAARIVSPGPGSPTTHEVDVALRADRAMVQWLPSVQKEFKQLLRLFDNGLTGIATGTSIAPFTASGRDAQNARLAAWSTSRVAVFRSGYQAMKRLCCACYYAAPSTYKQVGYPGPVEIPFEAMLEES